MQLFHHLHYGLSAILVFVGVKMVLSDIYKIPIGISLGVVGLIIAGSIVASLVWPRKESTTDGTTGELNHKT